MRRFFSVGRSIKPYIDFHAKFYNKHPLDDELKTVLTWVSEKRPSIEVEDAVHWAMGYRNKIYSHIKFYKSKNPNHTLDIFMMDIFEILADNYRYLRKEKAAILADLVYANMQDCSDEEKTSRECLSFYFYCAETWPDLPKAEIPQRINEVKHKIQIYLDELKNDRIVRIYPQIIGFFCWLVDNQIKLGTQTALRWANSVARSTLYARSGQIFPPTYPFSSISLETYIEGTARVMINVIHFFGLPYLDFLRTKFECRNGAAGIFIDFDLNKPDVREGFLRQIEELFSEIENDLKEKIKDLTLFNDLKTRVFDAAKKALKDFEEGYKGLKYLQNYIPSENDPHEDTEIGRKLLAAINERRPQDVRQILRNGADLNFAQWGMTPIENACDTVSDYTVRMMQGSPNETHFKEFIFPYHIILAKIDKNYIAYWKNSNGEISHAEVENKEDCEFLNFLGDDWFRSNSNLRSVTSSEHVKKMAELAVRATRGDLEKVREKEAKKISEIVEILMEYKADPGLRRDANAGTMTPIERFVARADLRMSDVINHNLLKELLRLTIRADQGRSYLWVPQKYKDHPLGQLILEAKLYLLQNNRPIMPTILSVTPAFSSPGLNFTMNDGRVVELRTVQNFQLTKNEIDRMYVLLRNNCSWQGRLSEAELRDYLQDCLFGSSHAVYVDLILRNNEICGYNIAGISSPKVINGKTVYLHFAIFSVKDNQHLPYAKLMWLVLSKRGFALKAELSNPDVEVFTVYDVISAYGYLLASSLHFFPERSCISIEILRHIHQTVYPESVVPNKIDEPWYIEDKLATRVETLIKKEFADPRFFSARSHQTQSRDKKSLVIAFRNDLLNLTKISMEMNPYIANMLYQDILPMAPVCTAKY